MFLVLFIILILLIYYVKRSYFTVHDNLPGLTPHVLFGNLIQSGILFRGVSLAKALYTFKARFGDVFQFWLGSLRIIVVSGTDDVKHIFTRRQIYDKGDLSLKTFGLFFFNAMICNKGLLTIFYMNENFYRMLFRSEIQTSCSINSSYVSSWQDHIVFRFDG